MLAAVLGALGALVVAGLGVFAPAPEQLAGRLRRATRAGGALLWTGVPFALSIVVVALLGVGGGAEAPLVAVLGLLVVSVLLSGWFGWRHLRSAE